MFLWILLMQFCFSGNRFMFSQHIIFVANTDKQACGHAILVRTPWMSSCTNTAQHYTLPFLFLCISSLLLSSGDHPLLSPALTSPRTTSPMTCNILENGRNTNTGLALILGAYERRPRSAKSRTHWHRTTKTGKMGGSPTAAAAKPQTLLADRVD